MENIVPKSKWERGFYGIYIYYPKRKSTLIRSTHQEFFFPLSLSINLRIIIKYNLLSSPCFPWDI